MGYAMLLFVLLLLYVIVRLRGQRSDAMYVSQTWLDEHTRQPEVFHGVNWAWPARKGDPQK